MVRTGNKDLKIPSYLPFEVPLVEVEPSPGLFFKLTNLKLHGLDTAAITDIKIDLEKQTFMLKLFTTHSKTISQYEVDGKLLSFAVYGTGPAEITSVNATTHVSFSFGMVEKDGKRYINISSILPIIDYNPGIVHYQFDNLFGGNKLLGDNINKFMNENPDEVADITNIPNVAVIKAIILQTMKSILRGVSIDEVFS
ncbi:unnamed protein product [Phaedon cochleariae]|uniref:Uncharacterized protein n=1 Tax=Phaedon cochleariae TaxID=80249 RepID=A0A9N9SKR4_PHACE|nr:unnamed protein product [Phaedon cochleariae]